MDWHLGLSILVYEVSDIGRGLWKFISFQPAYFGQAACKISRRSQRLSSVVESFCEVFSSAIRSLYCPWLAGNEGKDPSMIPNDIVSPCSLSFLSFPGKPR